MKLFKRTTNRISTLLIATVMAVGICSISARASNLSLSDTPLFLGGNAEANIMFTLDDSGSMQWEILPSSITYFAYLYPHPNTIYGSGDYSNRVPDFKANNALGLYLRTPAANVMWYNPKTRYDPWLQQDGTPFPAANPGCALHNPANPGVGCRDLTQANSSNQWWGSASGNTGPTSHNHGNLSFWPAVYNTYIPNPTNPPIPYGFAGGPETTSGNYTQTLIKPGPGTYPGDTTNRTDCVADPTHAICTYTEEIQNFANWYTYFRSRVLTARAGIGRAFAQQGSNMRVGFAAINQGNKTIDGVTSSSSLITGVRRFSGVDRTNWFNQLYGHPIPRSGTPLRRSMDSAGRYYQRTDNKGPWGNIPGTNDTSPQSTCRQSYHILMTDGQWNGSSAFTSGARQNVDGQNGPSITTPTSFQYTPANPYKDNVSGTLGDVAMYFWNRDLRPGLANQVPPNVFDPAYWQHMVNFTVGLGVVGTLTFAPDVTPLSDPNPTAVWPSPTSSSAAKVDDLWHAAVNSRGTFFSAKNPTEFANGLSAVLNNINSRTSTASSVSVDSASINTTNSVFQARFDSGTWSGSVVSIPLSQLNGSSLLWDAQTQVSAQNFDTGRKIVTFDPTSGGGGMPFRWGSLTPAQQKALKTNPDTGVVETTALGQSRLDYLRGKTGISGFRLRPQGVLGDIVHSGPVFVGPSDSNYPDFWGVGEPETNVPYSSFVSTNASRQGMVYAGGNDGMLHAFDATTGNEVFAYVPNVVFGNLNRLTSPNYGLSHKYYVDGPSTAADVFFGGAWHTVLVGALRGGGQGIYALDITDPNVTSEASVATNKVLWEFTDKDDADLGYTFSEVNIARMPNGKWAAIFGNGYNNMVDNGNDGGATNDSTTGNAVLYIVDIETGALIKKIDTGQGLTQSTTTPKFPNGLASPLAVDSSFDFITTYIYAGDLQGNMWKFDVSSSNTNNWKSAYLTAPPTPVPVPLFTATDAVGVRQPITTAPDVVSYHPTGVGSMVYFGTGKYMEPGDNNIIAQPNQTFYAIWDKGNGNWGTGTTAPPVGFSRNHLLQQKILQEVSTANGTIRAISNKNVSAIYQMNWHTGGGLPTGLPPTTHLGWYLDLINTDPATAPLNNYGEKLITRPSVISGKVIFNTFLPPTDPCAFGGGGWLMLMDAFDGGGLSLGAGGFDVNGDNKTNSQDYVTVNYDANGDGVVNGNDKIIAGGIKSGGGLGGITIVSGQNGTLTSVFHGENKKPCVGPTCVEQDHVDFGGDPGGRKSWIRLQ